MQTAINTILQQKKNKGYADALKLISNMSLGSLKQSTYTIPNLKDALDDVDLKAMDVLGKLVACSKKLSLEFVLNYDSKFKGLRGTSSALVNVLRFQQDERVLSNVFDILKVDLKNKKFQQTQWDYIVSHVPNFIMDNLQFFTKLVEDDDYYEAISGMFLEVDYKTITDDQFMLICDMTYSLKPRVKHLGLSIGSFVNLRTKRVRPLHDGFYETMVKENNNMFAPDIRCSYSDFYTLMERYPESKLWLSATGITPLEIDSKIEHFMAYIKRFIKSDTGDCLDLLNRFCDLSLFVPILLECINYGNVKWFLQQRHSRLNSTIAEYVNLCMEYVEDKHKYKFLVKAYPFMECRGEFEYTVLPLLRNIKPSHGKTGLILIKCDGYFPHESLFKECLPFIIRKKRFMRMLSPKFTRDVIKVLVEKYRFRDLVRICRFKNVRIHEKLIIKSMIDSNKTNYWWRLANKLESKYAVSFAWQLGKPTSAEVLYAIEGGWIAVPSDEEADLFLRRIINEKDFPDGKVLAFIYQQTGCLIHINLIKRVFHEIEETESFRRLGTSLSKMILNMQNINYKEELRSILVHCMLQTAKSHQQLMKMTIKRLGNGEGSILDTLFTTIEETYSDFDSYYSSDNNCYYLSDSFSYAEWYEEVYGDQNRSDDDYY